MTWSLLVCFFIPFFIPSPFMNDGIGSYTYGFPLEYITIYQRQPSSGWFFNNFFSGNAGLHINPATYVLNVFIIYLIVRFVVNIRYKKKGIAVSQ